MVESACDEDMFIRLVQSIGPAATARQLGIGVRKVYERRARIERDTGEPIKVPTAHVARVQNEPKFPQRVQIQIDDGVILVASDAHYWPGEPTTAHRAFVRACKEMRPAVVIMNGDALDGARISRHAPIGWETRPTLIDEIEVCKQRLDEIRDAATNAKLIWPIGNHDARFETRIATVAPEYAKVYGVHLKDHFPEWWPCWSVWINDDVIVKHRFRGGVHAAWNNAVHAGKTIVTGHTHSLLVRPMTDYNGTRYGVETGTLADPYGAQFLDYTEDGPRQWRSGFAVLTFRGGRLLWPEMVSVCGEGEVEFRGKVYAA